MRMLYMLNGADAALTVSSLGAEVQSLRTGDREWIWRGDRAVWGRHAPLCFPWCGRLKDGYFQWEGARYENGAHGFARDLEHTLIHSGGDRLAFRLESGPETLERYPWPFRLDTEHTLAERTLTTSCTVTNTGAGPMPFQLGFHFAFALPEEGESAILFQEPEEAREVLTPDGLTAGERPRFTGRSLIPLDEELFAHDSICLTGLRSKALGLALAGGGSVKVGVEGFPYVLLWSKPGRPQFVCIEPWHGLPDAVDSDHDLFRRPAVRILPPGGKFTAVHTVRVFP